MQSTSRFTPPVGDVLTAPIVPGQYTVGSDPSAQIQLPYEGVAEQHVVLWVAEDRVVVDPLVEGVQVNGQPIAQRVECAFPVSLKFAGLKMVLEERLVQELPSQPEAGLEIQNPPLAKDADAPSSSTASPPATESQCAPTIVGAQSGPPPRPRSGAKSNAVESAQTVILTRWRSLSGFRRLKRGWTITFSPDWT
jgi:hypothetical protein